MFFKVNNLALELNIPFVEVNMRSDFGLKDNMIKINYVFFMILRFYQKTMQKRNLKKYLILILKIIKLQLELVDLQNTKTFNY